MRETKITEFTELPKIGSANCEVVKCGLAIVRMTELRAVDCGIGDVRFVAYGWLVSCDVL